MGCKFPEHHQSGGGGGLGPVVAVLVALVIAAEAAPAVAVAAHVVAVVLTVAAIVAGLAALAGLALVAVRVRRRALARPRAVPYRVTVLDGRQAAEVAEPTARALPAARDDVSAYPRDRADPHVVTGRVLRPRCPRQRGRWS